MIQTEIGWNTRAMAMPSYRDGIEPATASCIAREFGNCFHCGSDIDPDVTDALYQDRDVIWENDDRYKSSAHTCCECGEESRIFVEEKAFGTIGPSQLPEDAEENENIIFIPIEDSANFLVINTHQIMIGDATPLKPRSGQDTMSESNDNQ